LPAAAEVQQLSEPEPQPESRAQRASQRLAQPPPGAQPVALEPSLPERKAPPEAALVLRQEAAPQLASLPLQGPGAEPEPLRLPSFA
jgi:hypothetical protein